MSLYDAFISYSHAKDKPIAAALQSVAQRLGKAWYRRRAARIFRDDTSLTATPYLWPDIEHALDESRLFILLASPEAATSKWVNKEVEYWLEHKGIDALLIGVTRGELSWDEQSNDFSRSGENPLPPALAGRFSLEPRWVDLRSFLDGVSLTSSNFIDASAEFAAFIRNIPKEGLLSREIREKRKALAVAWSASALFFVLAGVATALAVLAYTAERMAASNYLAAKQAADDLVASIASDLRQEEGIRTSTLDIAFNSLDRLIRRVEQGVAQNESFVVRELRLGFRKIEYVFAGKPVVEDEMTALELSRATLLYEFSETYHRSDIAGARAKAVESLRIREDVREEKRKAGNDTWGLDAEIAATEVEIGDLDRKEAESSPSPDYKLARVSYEEALSLLEQQVHRFPDRANLARRFGQTVTRLGDLDMKAGERTSANLHYAIALDAAIKVFRLTPNDDQATRELGWGFRKLGESPQTNPATAALDFADEVCVRRKLVNLKPSNALWARDLGYALTRLGGAKLRIQPPDQQGAEDAYLEAFHLRLRAVKKKLEPNTVGDFADGLNHLGEIYRERGDTTRSQYYFSAAVDVEQKRKRAFPDVNSLEDPRARGLAKSLGEEVQQQGPLAMINAAIQLEDADREFEIVQLPEIERAAQGCWDILRARIESTETVTSKQP